MLLCASTGFGLEAICRREIENLGYEIAKTSDGRVYFNSDVLGMIESNIWLRTAEHVSIVLAEFKALEFEDIFQAVRSIPWEDYIRFDDNYAVEGKSVSSKLSSVPACQSVAEKAIVERLRKAYKVNGILPKSGHRVKIEISLLKDVASIMINSSGPGLHKRGYRMRAGDAPIKETLASAMVQLSFWNNDRIMHDMFCGSGTICMEAAMIGRKIAPGLFRKFDCENYKFVDAKDVSNSRRHAKEKIDRNSRLNILGSDIDHKSVLRARDNAALFKLDRDIRFFIKDFRDLDLRDDYTVMISNPPYGERMGDKNYINDLYIDLGLKLSKFPSWSIYIISSLENLEDLMRRKADRKRKLYNGRIRVDYYQFYGKKPQIDKNGS